MALRRPRQPEHKTPKKATALPANPFAQAVVTAIRKKLVSAKEDPDAVSLFGEGLALGDVTEWIPTGFKTLDYLFGGGWPVRRASEVYGMEGCGKSALAQKAIRQCQLMGGTPMYIDFERALDAQKIKSTEIDPENLVYCDPRDVEEAWDMVWSFLDVLEKKPPKGPSIIVWDSVAGSVARAENAEESQNDNHVACVAKSMDKGARKMFRRIARVRAHMLWINQQRVKIGGRSFIPEYTTPGGAQLKFASSLRVKMFKRMIKQGDEVVGYECNAVTDKCRLVPPHRKAYFVLDFAHGPSPEMTMFRVLMEAQRIKKAEKKKATDPEFKGSWSAKRFNRDDWLALLAEDAEFRAGAEEVYAVAAEKMSHFSGSCSEAEADDDEPAVRKVAEEDE
jgi:protein RecA